MRASDRGRCIFGICVAAALLAGCALYPGEPPIAARAELGTLWMAPGTNTKDLLYVTNGTVSVYSYPQGELEGQLTGFSDAVGDCTDSNGNVYITDYTADTVAEYAHGGTRSIRTLSVPGSGALACAVDPSSGDLAVTTAGNASGTGANVAIFRKAKGKPKTYTYRAILGYSFCAYDNAGNLFVDGTPAQGYGYDYELAELPRLGKSFTPVNLDNGISWAADLQWNGHYLAVGQPVDPNISRYTISAGYGTFVGSTELAGAYDATQFVIAGTKAIVVNLYYYDRYIARWDVLVFNYPAGGYQTQEILESSVPVYSVALSRRRK
ncbi:MAG: hypothetical protein ABSD52_02000 [Candidatus Cybelea sp.]|jgi:hypothetical protein